MPAAAPPIELPARSAGPIERTIAEHVARLVPDQETIELGLGAIPETVTYALSGKRGIGVHSGAIGDGTADLMEAGIVDNRHKEIDPGITVATMLMGTRRLYRYADRNRSICIRATSYTHDALVADGVVTTPRAEADLVVTEHGMAELRGRTLAERAQALIAVADPSFRSELVKASERPL